MPFSYGTKVGDRFGSRVITGFLKERDTDGHLRCAWKCDCGNQGTGGLKGFRYTKQCEKCRDRNQSGGKPTHGHAGRANRTHLYDTWANMLGRTNGNGAGANSYRNKRYYKDKGITVCDAWRNFDAFRAWAEANGYEPGLSIDRIYTCRNYEPSNCEWITRKENTRRAFEKWRNHESTPIEMLWGTT